jgi:hypothetical protein
VEVIGGGVKGNVYKVFVELFVNKHWEEVSEFLGNVEITT